MDTDTNVAQLKALHDVGSRERFHMVEKVFTAPRLLFGEGAPDLSWKPKKHHR